MKAGVVLIFCFLYFNVLFSFENIPSTLALRLPLKISIESVVLLSIVAGIGAIGVRISRWLRGSVAVLLLLAALVRYFDVTALGVLGRSFDLYGDFPHIHRVFSMFSTAVSWEMIVGVVSLIFLVIGVIYGINWWGLLFWERTLREHNLQKVVVCFSVIFIGLFLSVSNGSIFSKTTSEIIFRQYRNLSFDKTESAVILNAEWTVKHNEISLECLGGANVFLIFLESYGVTAIEDEHHFQELEPEYRSLEKALYNAGYSVRSSKIKSPTFGGGSWRAHASFLSGVDVKSQHIYNSLIASNRQTLVSKFEQEGYRTIGVEPGIKWFWPDGEFYGFDRIYTSDEINYDGPSMGWWRIPDQFTLYRIYLEEIRDAPAPLFAKFSLIMSHIPYFPVPEYILDWTRFDTGTAFETSLKSVAHDAYRDLRELSSWYIEAFRYEFDVLEGFLLSYVPENSLTIVVGDHQPPKLVTHDNDSWEVPIHVLSKRSELVDRFELLGFTSGLIPLASNSMRMADFPERFLDIQRDCSGEQSNSRDAYSQ